MLRSFSTIISLCMVLTAMPMIVPVSVDALSHENISKPAALLSPGIEVIADDERMAVTAKKGCEAIFEAADFEAAAGVSSIDYITLTSLPDSAAGRLQIGSMALAEGQSVTRLNLSRMAFVPADAEVKNAEFSFSVNGSGYEYTCTVNFLDGDNAAPTLEKTTAALGAATYSGMPTAGRLAAYDADGDELFFSLTSYPRHGSILLTDRAAGSYIYMPEDGFSGRDSFSYTVRDKWGNRADGETAVSVRVTLRGGRDGFDDLSGSVFESMALRVAEAGIMGGTEVGGKSCFYPEQTVSRSEFLVMAMTAAGIADLPTRDTTVFADDEEIPASAKPYIGAAYELGVCDGWIKDGEQCFLPDETITVAEAAVITAGLLGIKADGDSEAGLTVDSVPAWASAEFGAMKAAGFVGAGLDGTARSKLDRIGCAELLCAIMRYNESKK